MDRLTVRGQLLTTVSGVRLVGNPFVYRVGVDELPQDADGAVVVLPAYDVGDVGRFSDDLKRRSRGEVENDAPWGVAPRPAPAIGPTGFGEFASAFRGAA